MARRKRDPLTGRMLMEGVHPTDAGTYRARHTVTNADGTRSFFGDTFATADEAEAWLLAQKLAVRQGTHAAPSALTVGAYYERWYARMARDWSGARQRTVRQVWERYARARLGSVRLQRLSRADVQALVDDMIRAGLAASTITVYLRGIVSMCEAAVRDGLLTVNPATALDYPRLRQAPPDVWSPLQLRRFLGQSRDDALRPLWAFLIGTGCRIGEALALHWGDLDLDAGTVWIHRTIAKDAAGRPHLKAGTKTNAAGRTVPLEPWLVAILRELPRSGPYVFGRGKTFRDPATVRVRWYRAVARAGMPKLTLHGIRHSVATAMIAAGVSERIVQEILGHERITTTLDTYAHVDIRLQRQGTAQLTTLLGLGADTTTSAPEASSK